MLKAIIYWFVAGAMIGVLAVVFSGLTIREIWFSDPAASAPAFNYGVAAIVCVLYGLVTIIFSLIFKLLFHK